MGKRSKEFIANPKSARSDDLIELREIMRAASEYLGTDSFAPPAVLNFVVDANVVLQHLGYLVAGRRNPAARSSIQELTDAGVVRFFGPLWLVHEVEGKIPKFAAMRGLPEAPLRAAWSEYRPQLHIFQANPVGGVDVVDPKDLPYAYAQRVIGADAVITEDPHLLNSNIPTLLTKLTHRELRDWARRRAVSDSIAVTTYGTAIAGVGVAGSAAKGIVQAVAKRPVLGGLLVAAGGLLWWWDSKRKQETGKSPTGELVRALGSAVGDLFEAYQAADNEADANMKVIRDHIGQPTRDLSQWLLTACIVARQPVAESVLVRRILDDGFRRSEVVTPSGASPQDRRKLRDMQLAYEAGQTLRNDVRFRWTGTGWTTILLGPLTHYLHAHGELSADGNTDPARNVSAANGDDQNVRNRSSLASPKGGRQRASVRTQSQSRRRKAFVAKRKGR